MALGKTITLFSECAGRLVDGDGTPQAGVRIERSWKYGSDGEQKRDETVTGDDGSFQFDAVTDRSLFAGILPGTPIIKQQLTAHGPDGKVTLWKAVKMNFDPNGELEGRPFRIVCRIDQEPNGEGPAWGTCREVENP